MSFLIYHFYKIYVIHYTLIHFNWQHSSLVVEICDLLSQIYPETRRPTSNANTDWGMAGFVNSILNTSDSNVRGANMGPTWVLSAPDGPHVGPMNLAIKDCLMS